METLMLSVGYEPLQVVSWKRAITLMTLGKVEVVEEYDSEVRSTHIVFKMPAVVRLLKSFRRHKKKVKFSRINVYARDRYKCQYCGIKLETKDLTFDHVLPRCQGGQTVWDNIVTACVPCNSKKAGRTPRQANMHLRKVPVRPAWVPVLTFEVAQNAPEAWRDYLYWTGLIE